MKRIYISEETHHKLKVLAAQVGVTMNEMAEAIILKEVKNQAVKK